jgi:hypothetical protein
MRPAACQFRVMLLAARCWIRPGAGGGRGVRLEVRGGKSQGLFGKRDAFCVPIDMLEFRIGDRVSFRPPGQGRVEGMVTRYNRKTVTVIADNGRQWNVLPYLLSKVIAQETASIDGPPNLVVFAKRSRAETARSSPRHHGRPGSRDTKRPMSSIRLDQCQARGEYERTSSGRPGGGRPSWPAARQARSR